MSSKKEGGDFSFSCTWYGGVWPSEPHPRAEQLWLSRLGELGSVLSPLLHFSSSLWKGSNFPLEKGLHFMKFTTRLHPPLR